MAVAKQEMRYLSPFIILAALGYASSGVAGDAGLLGDWAGLRSHAESAGITPAIVITADQAKPVQGGDDNAQVLVGNVDITFDVDLAQLLSLPGAQLFVYLLGNHSHASGVGDGLSDKVGAAQAVSNIEAPTAARLYEFWYEQRLFETWSVRAGLYDLNSEFDVIESAATLINSSFGIGADFAQTGENGPSIFPVTSLALRIRYGRAQGVYAQAAVFDGVPGDPQDERGTHVQLGGGDGVLQAVEAGAMRAASPSQRFYKLALGGWQYNPDQPLLSDGAQAMHDQRADNRGSYALMEYQLVQERADPAQGITLFLRHGVADRRINAIGRYSGIGLCWTGLIDGRDVDQLALGIAEAEFTDDFRALERALGHDMARRERVYEITYRAQVTPWLVLQPDLQFIDDPAFNLTSRQTTVALLRAEVAF